MSNVYLSLGSDIGDRLNNLFEATVWLEREAGEIMSRSSVYETESWGFESENPFLNQVILIQTTLAPDELMEKIGLIEKSLGRIRKNTGYESRNIDVDILFYDDLIYQKKNLTIPHPRLHLRNFTMIPLREIASEFIHPVFNEKMVVLAGKCKDQKKVNLFDIQSSKTFGK